MPSHTPPPDLPVFNVLRRSDLDSILKNWVGEKIFQRGSGYFERNRVKDLVITKDASLLATVKGSRDYVSSLRLDEDGKLDAACTCPYDGICKHIVALSLAGREALMAKSTLPSCGELDFRPEMLASIYPVSTPLISQTKLKAVLAKLSKETLLELLIKACELDRNTLLLCATSADPDETGIQAIITDAKRTIAQAAYSPDFEDEYSSHTGYDAIAQKLRIIVSAGKLDIVLDLANMVFNTCSNAIEMYDHDGEVIGEVEEVATVSLEALSSIDWAPAKKLIWAINSILHDNFGYCDCLYTFLRETDDLSAWSEVVSYLSGIQKQSLSSFEKSILINISKLSLKKAGLNDELLKLYETEAKDTNNYSNIVDYLLEQGRQEDAEKWIRIAINSPGASYYIKMMRKRLIGILEKVNDYDAIITLQTEIFVDSPGVEEYRSCATVAKIASKWDALKPLLILYLTDGKLPWLETTWPCENKGSATSPVKKFPFYRELVELALYENRPLDALKWHDQQRKSGHGCGFSEIRLAEAIKDAAPERAFEIWRKEVERLIAETNSNSYLEAGRILKKMLVQAKKMGDKGRWLPYLRTLREQHRRKRNFIKVLDSIEQGNNEE